MSADVMSYALAVGTFTVMALRLRRVRASHAPSAVRFSVLMLGALTVTFGVFAPSSQAWVNQYVGDGFKLLGNCSTLVAMFAASAMVLHANYPVDAARAKTRRRGVLLLIAVAVMVAMFVMPHPVPLTGSFDGLYAIDPTLVVYTVSYATYFGGAVADHAVRFFRFARRSSGSMRLGLHVMAVAALVAVAHNVATLVVVARNVTTGSRHGPGDDRGVCHAAFSDVGCFVAIGSPTVAAGLALGGFGIAYASSRAAGLRRMIGHRGDARRLKPLWQLLMDAFPELAARAEPHVVARSRMTAADQVADIRDALLLLAPYRRADVARRALERAEQAGMVGTSKAAAVEAASIVAALEEYRSQTGQAVMQKAPQPPVHRGDDLDEELQWLTAVSEALECPVVGTWAIEIQDTV